ncbi:hypothetical protein GCM10028806_29730 [Spirosoma terrae]
MGKANNIFVKTVIVVALVATDLFIYACLGVALMRYDDSYDESKGEYWSWVSMTPFDRTISVTLTIWNIVNIVTVGYLIYKAYRKLVFKAA